jgi:hypothetical protein
MINSFHVLCSMVRSLSSGTLPCRMAAPTRTS